MGDVYRVCQLCGEDFDFSRAAIVLRDGRPPQYEPFMEDWRGGYVRIAHPKCFAEREGVDALLAAVELNDRRARGDL